MRRVSLNGKWTVSNRQKTIRIPASVPGDVHGDLLRAKAIPDPFHRDNENSLLWIGETDWTYSREFNVSSAMLKHDRLLLKCHGLDTLATVRINGRKLGSTDNMHRIWEWDVKNALRPGRNTITITFASATKYCRKRRRERLLPSWTGGGRYWIRKEQCNFDWDWGLAVVTCGIWRDIELLGVDGARITDLSIKQNHRREGVVELTADLGVERLDRQHVTAIVTARLNGRIVDNKGVKLRGADNKVVLKITDPKLWWPNNMGDQPLYDIETRLIDADGSTLDASTKRIGLRTLVLDRHKDKWGQSFQFVVNGVPFFAKGANWIPADAILSRMDEGRYRRLLEPSAAANMNMLRVWGGGIYENDIFYNICDELGICIWQDFMFACASYPTFDREFMATVKEEVKDNVTRLRHHPSIAFWCGNNEIEQGLVGKTWTGGAMSWSAYSKLFDKLIPEVVADLDPDRDYWPGSPHTPLGDREDFNNPTCGDAHLWGVWHSKKPFEWYRECEHRFNSEFGFQSFPEPRTVNGFTEKRDRNITSRIMEHHQRSGIGNATIMQYMLEWFRMPEGFENTLWASQILQGMAIKYAVEHWRRSMPRGMGTLYWQLNDCWPVASWASIDFHGRWKALHYMARHFFAPTLISGLEDRKKGTVEIHVTSDALKEQTGTFSWCATDAQGRRLAGGERRVRTPANGDRLVETLRLDKLIDERSANDVLVWLELKVKGQPVKRNLVLFARPKHIELSKDPCYKTRIEKKKDGSFAVIVSSKRPALWVWLEIKGVDSEFSDNFFHLRSACSRRVIVTTRRKASLRDIQSRLRIRSLVDTY